ncbi:hypothetical protein LTR37_008422 [Vermiconidia calcicola]|uniref:Uncharacterized protein n=1 Tax=Vermiconidia calcicola TaxID=1690605 RepID=A0ACC3NAU5_9PEZI|nr:hypothetical protein LTR37_008422 [Vermiconidia calcicola]
MATDLSNWRESPHNIWAFQNVNTLLDTHTIQKGAESKPLESTPVHFDDFKLSRPDGQPMDLPSFLTETETDGIVVLKDGKVVFEHYDRTNTAESIHIMMSMSKSVTGLVCGILVDKGQLDVEALVSRYVPEIEGTPYESVTVRQLLDMRSGVKYDDSTPAYRKAAGWNVLEEGDKPTHLHEFISSFQAEETPRIDGLDGAPFEYVSVNTDLVGWIVERASGMKLADLISELIWKPMHAESDAYITVDRAGNARAAGGMCATVRDIARIGQLVLHNDNGVVPAGWIHDMLNNGSAEAFSLGSWRRGFEKYAYRSYWLAGKESDELAGLGIHGQHLFVDRKNGIVMAKTSSQPDRIDMKKVGLTMAAFEEFQRILTGSERASSTKG